MVESVKLLASDRHIPDTLILLIAVEVLACEMCLECKGKL